MAKPPPKPRWRTVPYIASGGRSDVLDYLEDLKTKDFSQWQHFQNIKDEMLNRGPFDVGPPHWVGVGGGLFELRWRKNRIYCSIEPTQRIVMYVAVLKRWRLFRATDRAKCESRRAEFLSPDYDEQQREYLYLANRQRRQKDGPVQP